MRWGLRAALLAAAVGLLVAGCGPDGEQAHDHDHEHGEGFALPSSEPLTPAQSREAFQVAPGFRVELVAAEPAVQAPVALAFGPDGRIFVVEMRDFMPRASGGAEEGPRGRIRVLEDRDGDGHFEHAETFLGGLTLPRAVGVVRGGLLVAEPPKLWHVEREGTKAGAKTLVDGDYAAGRDPEHQPNGLLWALDNWIYSAKSDRRYRRREGGWEMEPTEFRGQWGITQDDYGRLFYNLNYDPLRGDWLLPNTLARNPHLDDPEGMDVGVVDDQRVWPARPTPGVNRGGEPGVLDAEGRLKEFTAASGPVIFRGDAFPEAFRGNAFVPEPAGNLVKYELLEEEDGAVEGRPAWEGREFLASTDERFRPVNLYTAPDGTLFVVDMSRGVIQYKAYMTDYLRDQIEARGLETPITLGRIWRVVHEDHEPGPWPRRGEFGERPTAELVPLLAHENGWWRDTAQRLLVERGDRSAVPRLEALARDREADPRARIHALWTLEGLGALRAAVLGEAVAAASPKLAVHALRLAGELADTAQDEVAFAVVQAAAGRPEREVRWQRAASLGRFAATQPAALEDLAALALAHGDEEVLRDVVVAAVPGREEAFLARLEEAGRPDGDLRERLEETAARARSAEAVADTSAREALHAADRRRYDRGEGLYLSACTGCHGLDARGMEGLGSSLVASEWVAGPPGPLVRIVLDGGRALSGDGGGAEMPGFRDGLSDGQLAALLTYVRVASGMPHAVRKPEIAAVREATEGRGRPWTAEELRALE